METNSPRYVQRLTVQPQLNRLAAWKAKFLVTAGAGGERRSATPPWSLRQNLKDMLATAGLTPIYIWMATSSTRVAALCLNATGGLFAIQWNRAHPVTIAQAWAFALACHEWAESREVENPEAASRWEEAVLRQLQSAEPPFSARLGAE